MPKMNKKTAASGGAAAALIAAIIGVTIALEGGYVNHPNDPGGETNKGITKKVAVEHGYTGPMRTLPEEVAVSIYYQTYLVKPGYEPLVEYNAPVVAELFDTTVNMGPARPSRWFQETINEVCNTRLPTDGKVGPQTRKAFTDCQQTYGAVRICRTFLDRLDQKQRAEYDRLVRVNSSLRVFHRGWINHRIGNVPRSQCEVTQ